MRSSMRSSFLKFVLPIALAASAPAQAATAPAASAADSQSIMSALTKANAAVVGVKVTAVDGARSAQTLGLNRRGSGVVIGADGLVLTIGMAVDTNILIHATAIDAPASRHGVAIKPIFGCGR
mgnify:CR=1 FL=1